MPDDYETCFQLDPSNPADASLDPDGDTLPNRAEAAQWTDPHTADTDRDGRDDATDDNPLSRAFIAWGDPASTYSNAYLYPGPAWLTGAWKDGGYWLTNPPGWLAAWQGDTNPGALVVEVDRALLTNDAILEMDYLGGSEALLYIDLAATNATAVATNLFGNLVDIPGRDRHTNVVVPLAHHRDAARIRIRREAGNVLVYGNLLYPQDENAPAAATDSLSSAAAPAPAPAPLQAAVDAAQPGSILRLPPGRHTLGATLLLDKPITLRGAAGDDPTILDGAGAVRCLHLRHPDAVVENLTLTGGCDPQGGGALCEGGTLRDCTLIANDASGGSGGGLLATGPVTLERCHILGNTADFGGGLEARSDLTLVACVVSGNVARVDGGGLSGGRQVVLRDTRFAANVAGRDGGAINAVHGTVLAGDALGITGNRAGNDGGGCLVKGQAAVTLAGEIADNVAAGRGGGIFAYGRLDAPRASFRANRAARDADISHAPRPAQERAE